MLPWTATLFVTAPIAGALVNRVGERPLIAGGLLMQAVGMAWIALIAAPDRSYLEFIAPMIVAGIGVSMAIPSTQNAIISAVAAGDIGKASGMFSMVRQLGGAFGVAILAAVFAEVGGLATARAFSNGFVAAMSVSAVLSLLGAMAGLVLPGRPGRPVREAEARESEASSVLEQSL